MQKVSIISVNYNGKKLLPSFLSSVRNLDYPKKDLETLIVDNGSTDGSAKYLRKNFPWVRVIELDRNIGFGAGNNIGMKAAKGNFFLLINNDTYMSANTIASLLDTYKKWSNRRKIASVSAKLVLYDRYLIITVENAYFHDYKIVGGDTPVNKRVYVVKPVNEHVYVIRENNTELYQEKVYIPLPRDFKSGVYVTLVLKTISQRSCNVILANKTVFSEVPTGREGTVLVSIKLSKAELLKYSKDLIQNAGNFIFRDGFARDRGVKIYGGEQFYEEDEGQYDKEEILPAFCGAAVLINKHAIKNVGLFDENFFMYYEDIDLSLRFKKSDWVSLYSPRALVRHIHSASSKEWSPFFIYNVERGRLFLVLKHWPLAHALWAYTIYLFKSTLLVPAHHLFYAEIKEAILKFILRIRVNLYVLLNFPKWLFNDKRLTGNQIRKFL